MRKIREEEFESHKEKMYLERIIKKENECWDWKGTKDKDGYGRFNFKRKQFRAHRFAWERHFGKIPQGLIVGHHCDSPACTRIDHLYLGTTDHNSKDMVKKNRQAKGSKNGGSKLYEEQVQNIKKLLNEGKDPRNIAKDFNLAHSTVYRIRSGKTWKHVT